MMPPKRKRQSSDKSELVSGSPKRPKKELENKYKEAKIRIGTDYQAVIPDLMVLPSATVVPRDDDQLDNESELMWAPTDSVSEEKLNEYILLSKDKYGLTREQSLSVLYKNHYDMENAINALPNVKPLPADNWTPEDNAVFESAYEQFGTNFSSIKNMMPHKPIGSLVKYYYQWKWNKHTNHIIDLDDIQEESSSVEPNDKMAKKPTTSGAKNCLWKRKSQKRGKICVVDKHRQEFNSAEPGHES